jgi:hypothetical protein
LTGDNDVLTVVASTEWVYMSIFVLGELHAEFAGGVKQRENKAILNRFLSKPSAKFQASGFWARCLDLDPIDLFLDRH